MLLCMKRTPSAPVARPCPWRMPWTPHRRGLAPAGPVTTGIARRDTQQDQGQGAGGTAARVLGGIAGLPIAGTLASPAPQPGPSTGRADATGPEHRRHPQATALTARSVGVRVSG